MKIRTLIALCALWLLCLLCACGRSDPPAPSALSLQRTGTLPLDFATQFSVDEYAGGYRMIALADGSRFFLLPKGAARPDGLDPEVRVLSLPLENIYLAATSAMCLFDSLGRLDAIRLSGTRVDGWTIENARRAMEAGEILFAGKYNAPDYELITACRCPLAIESTMIGHASQIKEQLEELGIPVLVDQSSNEPHPLGRAEWIKLYGVLLGEEEKANEIFAAQIACLDEVLGAAPSQKTVAFFYVSSTGRIIARRSGDYVCKMISLAGGRYVFDELGEAGARTSTVTLDPEFFYANAKDADILIYNAAIADEVETLEQMLEKCALLRDFKAVKSGEVWCTGKDLYQESTALGQMIQSMYTMFSDGARDVDELPFFYRLK